MPSLPTFVAAGAASGSDLGITPGLPAGIQEFDVMFLFVETDDQAVATPSGWTSMFSGAQGGASRLQIFWKRVGTAAESAPSIADAGDHQLGIILAFRGCRTTGNPYDVVGASANGTTATATANAITTTVANTLVVFALCNAAATTLGSYTNANLANITERADVNTTAGNDGALGIATGEKATAGSTGTTTAVPSANPAWCCVQFALRNADEIVLVPPIAGGTVSAPLVQNLDIQLPHIGPTSSVFTPRIGTHARLSSEPVEVVLEPEPDVRLSTEVVEVVVYPNPHARLSSEPIEVVVEPADPAAVLTQMPVEVVRRQSNEHVEHIWWD